MEIRSTTILQFLSMNKTQLLSVSKTLTLLTNLIIDEQADFDDFLKKLIKIITKIIPVTSCFIYLHDQEKKELILIGSKKPHDKEVGKIVLKEGEGITGWVAIHKKAVVIKKEAYKDKRFKFFKELPEDKYESFLSVPIINGSGVIGVINLQNRSPYIFSKAQITTVSALMKVIAAAFKKISMGRTISKLEQQLEERKIVEKAKGILMKERHLNENDAYTLLRKEAMNKRKSIKTIAEAVLLVYN